MSAKILPKRQFTSEEDATWATIMNIHYPRHKEQIHPLFMSGLSSLQIDRQRIPDLDLISDRLRRLTGWSAVFVEGLESWESFCQLLAQKKFPVGRFIRDGSDLNYTPAPDVVHDLYGHLPFLASERYANFIHRFCETAMKYMREPVISRQFERVFWFTAEFALIETPNGRRIFGAGIASSVGECEYALSNKPQVLPFHIDTIRRQEYRTDEMQKTLFLLQSPEQLFFSLAALEHAARGGI